MNFEQLNRIIRDLSPINKFFEEILNQSPDSITWIVTVFCIVLFLLSLFYKRWRDISPASMLSAGIIGTFWGTFIALSGFRTGIDDTGSVDSQIIVSNIPIVLGGMTTAFITSLIGLFSAFFSKIIFRFMLESTPQPLPIEQETIGLLKEIKEGIVGESDKSLSSQIHILQEKYRDGMNDLRKSIDGENDSSVTSQLIKLRNENAEGFKKLDGLADAIRVSLVENLQALMKELRTVIIDQLAKQLQQTNELLRQQLGKMLERIEEALINQFGKTFQQFNEATQAIKQWQEDHREQVEQLTEAFKLTTQGIENIRRDCDSIPDTMVQLKQLMGELDERLKAFADMKREAEQSFPVIKENLDKIGSDLQKSAAGFTGLERTITETYTKVGDLAQEHIETVEGQINKVANQLKETTENAINESRNASNQHQKEIRNIAKTVAESSEQCINETREHLTKLAEDHAQTVSDAMTAIAQKWGENMVGIAKKMGEMVGIAEKIREKVDN